MYFQTDTMAAVAPGATDQVQEDARGNYSHVSLPLWFVTQQAKPSPTTGSKSVQHSIGRAISPSAGGRDILPSMESMKVQFEKPQIFLLLKGPNDETYYQPLIISQTFGATDTKPSSSKLKSFHTNITHGKMDPNNVSTNTILKEPQANEEHLLASQENIKTTTNVNGYIKRGVSSLNDSSEHHISTSTSDFVDSNVANKDIGGNYSVWLPTKTSEVSDVDKHVKGIDSAQPVAASMQEVLKEIPCHEFQDTSIDTIQETKCDSTIMDSNDIFSFILSPDTVSPSECLGKLSLSSNYDSTLNTGDDELDSRNASKQNSNQEHNFLDTISEHALKELLFGNTK